MRTVALPIEEKVREFHGKIWLGIHLAERGYEVIIGKKSEVKWFRDEFDIYVATNATASKIDEFKFYKDNGIMVCVIDAEGGVFSSPEDYQARNSSEAMDFVDCFFAWGERPAEIIADSVCDRDKIHVTGNPRFDLLSRELRCLYVDEGRRLREKYSNYVLVNTNFSLANAFDMQLLEKAIRNENRSLNVERLTEQKQLLYNFLDAILKIKDLEEVDTVVIRPHPSEDLEFYEREFEIHNNVIVDDSGDVRNWIAGASAVVHNSCTTGIESALLETTPLAYFPFSGQKYAMELPNRVSVSVDSGEQLLREIAKNVNRNESYQFDSQQEEHLKKYFYNIDKSAVQPVSDRIEYLAAEIEPDNQVDPSFEYQVKKFAKTSSVSESVHSKFNFIRDLLSRDNYYTTNKQYFDKKFDYLSREELETVLLSLEEYSDSSGRRVERTKVNNVYKIL